MTDGSENQAREGGGRRAEDRAAKHTVLIVHGTFSGPREGTPAWYEPGSPFCRALDERLAALGSPARCWAHLDECGEDLRRLAGRATPWFSWSGANSWLDRAVAADGLSRELGHLAARGWSWSVVAHSHGGNVALEAFGLDRKRRGLDGRVVLLGTPMLTYSTRGRGRDGWQPDYFWEARTPPSSWPFERKVQGRQSHPFRVAVGALVSVAAWGAAAAWLSAAVGVDLARLLPSSARAWGAWAAVVLLLGLGARALLMLGMAFSGFFFGDSPEHIRMRAFVPMLLLVNSERDEAWNFLSSVLAAEDPLRRGGQSRGTGRGKRLLAHLSAAGRRDKQEFPGFPGWGLWLACAGCMAEGVLTEAALGGDPFASGVARHLVFWPLCLLGFLLAADPRLMGMTLLVPWRAAVLATRACASVGRSLAARYVRHRAWRDIQRIAFGLLGSPHRMADVGVHRVPPEAYAAGEWLYEPVAPEAEAHAVERRRRALLSGVDGALSSPDADLFDIERLRARIGLMAADTQLVHTVYYRHPAAIEQVARHLARTERELVEAMRGRPGYGPPPTPRDLWNEMKAATKAKRLKLSSAGGTDGREATGPKAP